MFAMRMISLSLELTQPSVFFDTAFQYFARHSSVNASLLVCFPCSASIRSISGFVISTPSISIASYFSACASAASREFAQRGREAVGSHWIRKVSSILRTSFFGIPLSR